MSKEVFINDRQRDSVLMLVALLAFAFVMGKCRREATAVVETTSEGRTDGK